MTMLTKMIVKEEQTTQLFHLTDMKTARKCAEAEAIIALILLYWDLSLVVHIMLLQLDWSKQ